jgi:multiple sugar transport system substrate-binding protein
MQTDSSKTRVWPAAVLALAAFVAAAIGCRGDDPQNNANDPPAPVDLEPLRLLVVDDPQLATVVTRQWQARADRELVVRETTAAELDAAGWRRLGADVVIYPSGMLGELAARELIEGLADETLDASRYDGMDLLELERLREVSWGGRVVAVTFGSPAWTLLYRRDMLERLGREPPETWAEYASLVEQLADREALGELAPGEGEPWSAAVEPLAPGWAGTLLLARAASYARHRSQYSTLFDYRDMTPLIDGPPFVRALRELQAVAPLLPADADTVTPAEARRRFLLGQCGIALTWPSRADDQSAGERELAAAFAELPGASEAYNFRSEDWEPRGEERDRRVTLLGSAGRLGSVTHETQYRDAATNLLVWMTGQLSVEVCAQSRHTTLFRNTHLAEPARWLDEQFDAAGAESYSETIQAAMSRPSWLFAIRIPGRDRYLAALDQAIRETLSGSLTAEAALSHAASQWQKITDALGRDAQQQAYCASIGLSL